MIDESPTGWIETYTGIQFPFSNPTVDHVDVRDCAWALAHINRYTGHGRIDIYSVAEHSLLVAKYVPQQDKLWALLHDAAEAYVGDCSSPLKRYLPDYRLLESRITGLIQRKFNLPLEIPQSVKDADRRITLNEKAVLFPHSQHEWQIEGPPLSDIYIVGLQPSHAYIQFIRMYNQLSGSNVSIYPR